MRQRLIALGVFALLVAAGIVLLLTVLKEDGIGEAADSSLTPTAGPLLEAMSGDSVAAFTVTNNTTGAALEAAFQNEAWAVLAAPESVDTTLPVDDARLESAAAALTTLTPTRTLEDVGDLAEFGLEPPVYTIVLETAYLRGQTLHVGNMNPGQTAYYVQMEGDDRVFLVNRFSLASVVDLVDTPPFLTPTPEPTAAAASGR